MNAVPLRVLALLALALPGACGGPPLDGPPDLRAGRDECAECGMIIMDDRACAAVLVEIAGRREHRLFDDLGCLIDFRDQGHADMKELRAFAVDHGDGTWLDVNDARFVLADTARLMTPMGSGYIAFAKQNDADHAMTTIGGRAADFDGLAAARRAWRASLHTPAQPEETTDEEQRDP
ncbi:MAG: nitrous oxide reductase accessory protein NosL [Phycisphaeraceae bacterium]|nr:MAG: nitrous oxide reductase accessory protein NosL [Phycisphaeraceae bacterium]